MVILKWHDKNEQAKTPIPVKLLQAKVHAIVFFCVLKKRNIFLHQRDINENASFQFNHLFVQMAAVTNRVFWCRLAN